MAEPTEDDLMRGIADAFGLASSRWLWFHVGRSDLAQSWGSPGVPDIHAVGRIDCLETVGQALVIEAKSSTGRYRPGQEEWLASWAAVGASCAPGLTRAVVVLTVGPREYDGLIARILGPMLLRTYGNRPGMSLGYLRAPDASAPAPARRGRPRRAGGRQW
jgi:hypothetical protein